MLFPHSPPLYQLSYTGINLEMWYISKPSCFLLPLLLQDICRYFFYQNYIPTVSSHGRIRTYDPLINQKLRFELKSLTIGQHISYAISAQSDALPTELHGNIISILYKIKEKTSKGICIGILHIPLSYINIITKIFIFFK